MLSKGIGRPKPAPEEVAAAGPHHGAEWAASPPSTA
eukprot:CAMPEP_0206274582 /NCGR_PEP_ID=MMETSP0047_2-20121206/35240_1 /ASSEMBLY_ACC=CAM_ASM_000192 /TAXON_ID=195065 /ORGANISM="Chroomonas mesostigmatica_cf, Strain CCMP1168" /LENGTH=35 /DNA_ID= /DNA_START= /DNA_END= /DNA_ORIENTATION=